MQVVAQWSFDRLRPSLWEAVAGAMLAVCINVVTSLSFLLPQDMVELQGKRAYLWAMAGTAMVAYLCCASVGKMARDLWAEHPTNPDRRTAIGSLVKQDCWALVLPVASLVTLAASGTLLVLVFAN